LTLTSAYLIPHSSEVASLYSSEIILL